MSWDAGAITGRLLFEVGQYASNINRSMSEAASMGHELTNLEQHAQQAGHGLDQTGEHAGRAGEKMAEAGEHGHGFLDVLKEHALAGVGFAAGMSAVEIGLELVKKAFELAWEAAKKFGETIAEVGNEAQKTGLEALKAGVPVEFFDDMAAAGKRVGVTMETLGQSFKFLQKNAVDAVTGASQDSVRGFESIGLSTEFLKAHLNDTRGLFEATRQKLMQIPDASDRVRTAMEIMGRGGADILPLFTMTNEEMTEAIDIHHRFGAAEDEASVKGAQGWVKASAAWDDMWAGIKRQIAEPVLEYLTDNWDHVQKAMVDFADAAVEAIPPAMAAIVGAMDPVLSIFQSLLTSAAGLSGVLNMIGFDNGAMKPLLQLSEELKALQEHEGEIVGVSLEMREKWRRGQFTGGRGRDGADGDQYITNLQLSGIDGNAPDKIAQAIAPSIRLAQEKAAKKQADALNRSLIHSHVSKRTGAQPITLFGGI